MDVMPTSDDLKRHLALEGSDNTRDLGGYPLPGGATRWKAFLRADTLEALSLASQQTLLDYGLTTVIDLREPREVERAPDVFARRPEVRYLNIPFMNSDPIWKRVGELETREAIYAYQLETCGASIRRVMEALADSDGCALFHCAGGKDRTGIIAAFLLALAGVEPDVIAHDYAITGYYMQQKFAGYRELAASHGYDLKRFEIDIICPVDSMLATLAHLDQQWGGAERYLASAGVSAETIAALRARLVDLTAPG